MDFPDGGALLEVACIVTELKVELPLRNGGIARSEGRAQLCAPCRNEVNQHRSPRESTGGRECRFPFSTKAEGVKFPAGAPHPPEAGKRRNSIGTTCRERQCLWMTYMRLNLR